jgi:hypothetical protein
MDVGQLGVGVPQGVEQAAGAAQWHHAAGFWIVALDLKNAFNSVLRSAIFRGLHEIYPELIPYFTAMYCNRRPPNLLFKKDDGSIDIISSQSGAQQGDPLGPFLFCVGIANVMKEYRQKHGKEGSGRDLSSYIDDMRLFFKLMNEAALAAVAELLAALKELGLVANDAKTEVLPPEGHVPTEEEKRLLARKGYALKEGIAVVGVPVGTEDFIQGFLSNSLGRLNFDRLARYLAALPDKQVAYRLLCSCLAAKPSFLARNVEPRVARAFFQRTDATLQWVLEHILEAPKRASAADFFASADPERLLTLTELQRLQIPLRTQDGGLQLRSMRQESASAFVGREVDTMGPIITRLLGQLAAEDVQDAKNRVVRSAHVEGLFQAIVYLERSDGVEKLRLSPTIPQELVEAAGGVGGGGAETMRRSALLFGNAVLTGQHVKTQRRLLGYVKKAFQVRVAQQVLQVPEVFPAEELDGLEAGSVVPETRKEAQTRLLSCSGAFAGAWTSVKPGGDTEMTSRQVLNALRLRLGMAIVVRKKVEGAVCLGANCSFGHAPHTRHALTCKNGQHAVQHKKMVTGVEKELDRVFVPHLHESRLPFQHNIREQDRELRWEIVTPAGAWRNVQDPVGAVLSDKAYHELKPGDSTVIRTPNDLRVGCDITIVCPLALFCQVNRHGVGPASTTAGVAARHAESSKMTTYHGKYLVAADCLRTFALESFGRPGRQALHFMDRIAEQAGGAVRTERERKVYLQGVYRRLSVVLQRAVGDSISRFEDLYIGGGELEL